MIKFPINPQDNGPLLKTQTPFIFTHPSVGQHLHAFLHTTHCTAELRTLQHTRYETDTYESHLRCALRWSMYVVGLSLCTAYRSRRLWDHPGRFGTTEPTPGACVLNCGGPQCLTRDHRHCMHILYHGFLQDWVPKQGQGWHHFENRIQDI